MSCYALFSAKDERNVTVERTADRCALSKNMTGDQVVKHDGCVEAQTVETHIHTGGLSP